MLLVDTSIWIDHLRHGNRRLMSALESQDVITHDFVIGELACGHLTQRDLILELLQKLPRANHAQADEVLRFIQLNNLMGRGIGYVDVHLMAAVALTPASRLWSSDRRLVEAATALGLSHQRPST